MKTRLCLASGKKKSHGFLENVFNEGRSAVEEVLTPKAENEVLANP